MATQRFTVALDGVRLTATQQKQLNAALQQAALTTLAGLGVRGGLGTHFPKEWLGIWIGNIKPYNAATIEGLGKRVR
jgi:hypothetical protein